MTARLSNIEEASEEVSGNGSYVGNVEDPDYSIIVGEVRSTPQQPGGKRKKKVQFSGLVEVHEIPMNEEGRSCTDWHKNLTPDGMARALCWRQELDAMEDRCIVKVGVTPGVRVTVPVPAVHTRSISKRLREFNLDKH
jgi:hypothetical protein